MSPELTSLVKLTEECGELQHAISKRLLKDQIKIRKIEDEIADVLAASECVIRKLNLNRERIKQRVSDKLFKHCKKTLVIEHDTGVIDD